MATGQEHLFSAITLTAIYGCHTGQHVQTTGIVCLFSLCKSMQELLVLNHKNNTFRHPMECFGVSGSLPNSIFTIAGRCSLLYLSLLGPIISHSHHPDLSSVCHAAISSNAHCCDGHPLCGPCQSTLLRGAVWVCLSHILCC